MVWKKLNNRNMDFNQEGYWIFIDNSNLFIEGQKFYAEYKSWRVSFDPRFRIDFEKLIDSIVGGKIEQIKAVQLYGSEPPSLDTLWKSIAKQNILVNKYKRNAQNKEKEVDQSLVVDATKYACKQSAMGMSGTFIFLTGDRDIAPCIGAVIDEGFHVLVVSYEKSLSKNINNNDKVDKIYLDDIIKDCCYLSLEFKSKTPINNSLIITFKAALEVDLIRKVTSQVADIFKLPCMYKFNKVSGIYHLALIFLPFSKNYSGIYDFGSLYRDNFHMVEKHLNNLFGSNGFIEIADGVSFWNRPSNMNDNIWEEDANKYINLTDESEFLIDESSKKDYEGMSCFSENNHIYNGYKRKHSETHLYYTDIAMHSMPGIERNMISSVSAQHANDETEWITKTTSTKKQAEKFSDYCEYGFTCNNGKKCAYTHRENEKRVFVHFGKGVKHYKSKKCNKADCMHKNDTLKCPFAHDLNEARCYKCLPKNGKLAHHWMDDCEKITNKTTNKR